MKMGHIIRADLTRFIHSSGSRTVNTQIACTVPSTSANTLDKIRWTEAALIPTTDEGRAASTSSDVILKKSVTNTCSSNVEISVYGKVDLKEMYSIFSIKPMNRNSGQRSAAPGEQGSFLVLTQHTTTLPKLGFEPTILQTSIIL